MIFYNVRIVNDLHEDGGKWAIGLDDARMIAYAKQTLADYQREEPKAGWRLETRGDSADWHRWKS